MNSGTLTGHALRVGKLSADHTYVTSSDGHIWPCWGRSSGGTVICTGQGRISFAECLSHPDGQAGILYAVSGVCHQAANRILFPSMQTVAGAMGYNLSVTIYGEYGKHPLSQKRYAPITNAWPELKRCRDRDL